MVGQLGYYASGIACQTDIGPRVQGKTIITSGLSDQCHACGIGSQLLCLI